MALLINAFGGLTELDFDVYRPECWSSNVHNLDRMKTKERVLALARTMTEAVGEDRLDLSSSSEIPSVWNGRCVKDQWAYLMRPKAARKTLQPVFARQLDLATRIKDPAEHHRHALLFIRIHQEGLEVGLRINEHATVDLANLVAKGEAEPKPLSDLLGALPEGIAIDGEPATTNRLLSMARATRTGDREWVVVSRTYEPAEAVTPGAALGEEIGAVAAALVPLYEYLEWRPDNDHVAVEDALDEAAAALAARRAEKAEADAKKAEAHAARQSKARARTNAKVSAEAAWREMQRKSHAKRAAEVAERSDAPAAVAPEAAPESAASEKKTRAPKPKAEAAPAPAAPREWKVGDKCRLTRGLLAGKEGEISAEDKKGYFKVKVGGFEVSVAAGDLLAP